MMKLANRNSILKAGTIIVDLIKDQVDLFQAKAKRMKNNVGPVNNLSQARCHVALTGLHEPPPQTNLNLKRVSNIREIA